MTTTATDQSQGKTEGFRKRIDGNGARPSHEPPPSHYGSVMSRPIMLVRALPLCVLAACSADDAVSPLPSSVRPHKAVAVTSATVEIVSVTPLPLLPGYSFHAATDINDAGTIVGSGFYNLVRFNNALRWTVGGGAPSLIIGTNQLLSGANAISQDGNTIVGYYGGDLVRLADPAILRFAGGPVQLSPCCIYQGQATGVNDVGQIVGWYHVVPRDLPALWSGGTTVDLLNGQSSGRAYDINNAGVVVGERTEGPFRWQGGTLTPLPTLGGATTSARSINESGVIVGVSGTTAVRWVNGAISPLAGVPGTNSRATDINESGQIVGTYVDPATGAGRAFFWSETGGLFDLGSGSPVALNNRGAIIGTSGAGLTVWLLNFAPTVQLTGPDEAKRNKVVSFSAAATDQNGDPLTYAWDFGDGTTGTGASVTHSYVRQDTYTVTVTVSDPRGLTGSASLDVSIENGKKPKKEHDNNGNGPKNP